MNKALTQARSQGEAGGPEHGLWKGLTPEAMAQHAHCGKCTPTHKDERQAYHFPNK